MSRDHEASYLGYYKKLSVQLKNGKPEPKPEGPLWLSLNQIKKHPEVFQHRRPAKHTSEAHIKDLAKVPSSGQDFDPITVWWDGKNWACIDGHHRMAAYVLAGKAEHSVQASIFSGTLDEAIAKAAANNTRSKLQMAPSEKTGTAWRLAIGTQLSKVKIVQASGASDGTVGYMRRTIKTLLQKQPRLNLSELSWDQARRLAQGQDVEEVDWGGRMEQEAKELADLLAKHLGQRGIKRKESFAMALEIYDAQLPGFLQEYWQEDDEGEADEETEVDF